MLYQSYAGTEIPELDIAMRLKVSDLDTFLFTPKQGGNDYTFNASIISNELERSLYMAKRIGRPKKWTDPGKMQKKIDEYFVMCEGKPLLDDYGEQVFNKFGEPIILNAKPPTVAGLACYLGMDSRQTLLNYQNDEEFTYVITNAKTRIEAYLEESLMNRNAQRGAEFNLRCNFRWNDKQDGFDGDDDNETGVVMIAPTMNEVKEGEKEDVQAVQS